MEYPVITICGSMRYLDQMLEEANRLSERGFIVLMPFVAYIKPGEQEGNPVKEMLDNMHFAKIDMSHGIYVVDVDNYIGESTTNEIKYAMGHGKSVNFRVGPISRYPILTDSMSE